MAAERVESRWVSKSSCASAWRAESSQGTVPSALPGSMTTLRCFSHQPDAPTCHPQRGRLANTGRAEAARQVKPRWWPAVLTLWLAGLQADDAAASHRAAGGTARSIEGARTYASGTSRGAGAVFPAFWTAMASAASPIPDFLLRAFLVDFAGSAPIRPMMKQVSKLLRRLNFGPDDKVWESRRGKSGCAG